ncbi:class I SAM-dependent methyltransferase [Streptococcus sp. DD12]|uniref:class I SAM-dependent methyltransferase n=1 Tax=Streptococcus sp. DD12 TaxID=1777880 RepID=UPI00079A61A6|nr:class I SAM-dependent methyltransferase [Streptococcus sp. DD12]KXT76627.1 Ribosomal RNA small subunit methyltransferase C [Streptococcus sp. DD12]
MAQMYFAEDPTAAHDIHHLDVTLLGETFTFATDAGVFSKKMIDYGSRVLLSAVDFAPKTRLLDVGCGYGAIGLTLAKVQGVQPTLVDINQRAVALAKENAQTNGVTADIFASNLYEKVTGRYQAIVSNPPIRAGKQVVHAIIEQAPDFLEAGGTLTLVIQKKQGAPSAKAKMAEVFGDVSILKKDKGYYILQSEKL